MEVRGAIIYSSLIEIAALLPVFFLEGLSGAFFRPLAGAYVVAGLISPIIALTVTPALVLIFMSNAPIEHRQSPVVTWLHRHYDKVLARVIQLPAMAYGTILFNEVPNTVAMIGICLIISCGITTPSSTLRFERACGGSISLGGRC